MEPLEHRLPTRPGRTVRFWWLAVSAGLALGLQACGSPRKPSSDAGDGDDVAIGGACSNDLECVAGGACDPSTGVCVVLSNLASVAAGGTCVDDGDCEAGLFCNDDGLCDTDPDVGSNGGPGASCQQDSDCASGLCDIVTDACM